MKDAKTLEIECQRCGHRWFQRKSTSPKVCPNLKCHAKLVFDDEVIYLHDNSPRPCPDPASTPEIPRRVKVAKYGRKPHESPRKKYPREWSPYTLARQNERLWGLALLYDALRILHVATYGKDNGRPPLPVQDKIFLCIQKVLRGTTYDGNAEFIEFAKLKEYISCLPRPHSVCDFMNDPQLTPILERLVVLTATPLADFETKFAIDSTGISTFDKSKWRNVRLDKQQQRDYRKLHAIVGIGTNIIVAAKVTVGTQHDSPLLIPLYDIAKEFFTIEELSGDGAYASRENAQRMEDNGTVPFFRLRKDARALAKGYAAWTHMVRLCIDRKDYYDEHYHLRSNIEATWASCKRKIQSFVRSKNPTAQANEALCIAVAHNLLVLVNAIYCLNLEVKFQG